MASRPASYGFFCNTGHSTISFFRLSCILAETKNNKQEARINKINGLGYEQRPNRRARLQ